MTDSERTGPAGKRERLVAAAVSLVHHNGVAATTLKDVAEAADVPLGNVYYYFRTKDDLVQAVIDAHADAIDAMLGSFERHRDPLARLKAFARAIRQTAQDAARHGCPHGGLSIELDRSVDGGLVRGPSTLLTRYVDWVERQFRLLGRADARRLAVTFVSVFQGGSLLANAFGDPGVLTGQVRWLDEWIDSLAEPPVPGVGGSAS